jgi:hypothetical protein
MTRPASGLCVGDGIRRVNRAPAILAGVWLLTLLVSLPLALGMRGLLRDHLGESLTGDAAADGVDYEWMQEFESQASGVGTTFRPAVIGFAAVLDNVSGFLDATPQPVVIVGAASAYLLVWVFLAGGIIDRYARDRAIRAHGFFSACGVFFWRFARLAIVQWVVYAFLFGAMHPWLFDRLFTSMTHDTTVERTAFLIRLVLYIVFGVVLAGCNIVFDYAKVRAVVEDRRSMTGAIAASARFIGQHYASAAGLYIVDTLMFAACLAIYAFVAPGAGRTGITMWFGFAVSQVYVAARLWVKLVFWASETALFQSRFAHAGYIAAPVPVWPDSPATDAIRSS